MTLVSCCSSNSNSTALPIAPAIWTSTTLSIPAALVMRILPLYPLLWRCKFYRFILCYSDINFTALLTTLAMRFPPFYPLLQQFKSQLCFSDLNLQIWLQWIVSLWCHIFNGAVKTPLLYFLAAELLADGQTLHSRFQILLNLHQNSMKMITKLFHAAELLWKTALIIWNKVPMQHKYCFEAVH